MAKNITQFKLDLDNNGNVTHSQISIGIIKGVYVKYDAGSASGTDVTLECVNIASGNTTILSLTNNNTSGWYYPKAEAHDTAGANITFDGSNKIYTDIPVFGKLKLTQAQNTSEKGVTVFVLVQEY